MNLRTEELNRRMNIDNIRSEIDSIDYEIVALLGKRAECVKNIVKFKKTEESIKSYTRVTKMLAQRREWAKKQNIDPNFIERLFSNIVEYFLAQQIKVWKKKQK